MPRYELSEGTSNKFWEIALDGASFTTAWGRIGTAGQSTVKAFDSEAKARAEHDKLVAEKVKKGYSLVGDAGPAASPKATPAPAPKPKTPTPPVATPDVSAPAAQPAAPAHPAATPGQVAIVWPAAFATRANKQAPWNRARLRRTPAPVPSSRRPMTAPSSPGRVTARRPGSRATHRCGARPARAAPPTCAGIASRSSSRTSALTAGPRRRSRRAHGIRARSTTSCCSDRSARRRSPAPGISSRGRSW